MFFWKPWSINCDESETELNNGKEETKYEL